MTLRRSGVRPGMLRRTRIAGWEGVLIR